VGTSFSHLFRLRREEEPAEPEEVNPKKAESMEIAQTTLDFATSKYHARLLTQIDAMISSAFKEMRSGSDINAGRAAGIQEVKDFIARDIVKARKVLNG
jgi:hypothetical protein